MRPSLLVLNSGRVVSGVITPRSGGYDVRKRTGRMFVASETVRFTAKDLDDAYRKLRSSFTEFTPEVHIRIARWCLANGQVNSARRELLDALDMEPHNGTATSMLKRMEASVVKQKRQVISQQTIAQKKMEQFLRTDHESLGGLSDAQAGVFVGRVQPILERRCGNSSCHGSASKTDFVLKRTRGYSSRLTAERNLAVVLKYVDFREPQNSALLDVMDRPHTRDGRPLFSGRAGTVQKKIVRDWVEAVTEKSASARKSEPTRTAQVTKVSDPALSKLDDAEKKIITKIRASNEKDPFDPAEFNRRHHSVVGRNQSAIR